MSAAADLKLLRASMLLESDPAAAARQAAVILAELPEHEASKLLMAAAFRRLGDSAGALTTLESLAATQPSSALLQLELGRAYAAAGQSREAVAALERAVGLDAALADGWKELAAQYFREGRTLAGDVAYLNYSRMTREPPELIDGHVALAANRLDAAEALVRQNMARLGDAVPALNLLASIATRRGDDAAAEPYLLEVLARAPGHPAAREELARLRIRLGRVEEALPLIERLLAAEPGNAALSMLKAEALRMAERHEEGLAIVRSLLAIEPDNPKLWLIAGNQLRFGGEPQEAVAAYRRAILLRPGYGEAYWALSNFKTLRFTQEDAVEMRRSLNASPAPAADDVMHLHFALGKALEDEGEYGESFQHYAQANAIARARFAYAADATTAFVRRFQATFTQEFFTQRAAWGDQRSTRGERSAAPIFIVGLPRSGSTLLEQILASHSDVEGTQELAAIPTIARELAARMTDGRDERFPGVLASLSAADVESLAARYLESTRRYRALGKRRFVDKMLGNFVSIGLIHLMFPGAAIIDSRRHPLGCGFSCYKQLFNPGMNFAYDLTELGLYIRDYTDLMQHVDQVLPGRVHRVQYEQLIADPEREVRSLLEYCALPYEAACLRYHENPRVAQTISSEQVRLPLYAGATEQWRHYRVWLEPMATALGSLAPIDGQ